MSCGELALAATPKSYLLMRPEVADKDPVISLCLVLKHLLAGVSLTIQINKYGRLKRKRECLMGPC